MFQFEKTDVISFNLTLLTHLNHYANLSQLIHFTK